MVFPGAFVIRNLLFGIVWGLLFGLGEYAFSKASRVMGYELWVLIYTRAKVTCLPAGRLVIGH